MSLFLALALISSEAVAAPWLRTFGMPIAGEPVTLRISGLTPGGTVAIAAGRSVVPQSTCPPSLTTCLDIPSARLLTTGTALSNGGVELVVVIPSTLQAGDLIALQAVDMSSGTVSTVMTRTLVDHIPLLGVWNDTPTTEVEINDQGTRTANLVTTFSDFNLTAEYAFETWPSPSTWWYWARLDWTYAQGSWWICRSTPTSNEMVVRQMGTLDRTDPSTRGCRGGAWTRLTSAPPDLAGSWQLPSGAMLVVDEAQMTLGAASLDVSRYSNLDGSLIGEGVPGSTAPAGWTRLDWVETPVGARACVVTRGTATEWASRIAPAPDAADFTTGCNGGAWLVLAP
jgi:hypothetical protein